MPNQLASCLLVEITIPQPTISPGLGCFWHEADEFHLSVNGVGLPPLRGA
jgi:hypothetical protein